MERDPDDQTRAPLPVVEYRHPDTDSPPRIDLTKPMYPLGLAASATVYGLNARAVDAGLLASFGLVIALSWYVACRLYRDERIAPRWRPALMAIASGCVILTAVTSAGLKSRIIYWSVYGFSMPGAFLPAIVFLVAYVILHATATIESSRS